MRLTPRGGRSRWLASCLRAVLLFCAAAPLAAGPARLQQRPTFRAGAHFVRVDAYPVREGQVIKGLTAEDFEVLEEGRPQAIETVEFTEFQAWTPDAERRDPNSVQEGRRLAADPRYRVFVIYYDIHHVSFFSTRRLPGPLTNMIERMLGPRDLIGFLTPRQEPGDLTLGQRAVVIERALDGLLEANTSGAELHTREESLLFTCYPWLDDEQVKAIIRTRRLEKVYTDLDALVAQLGALREERKNIVVISSDLTGPRLQVPDQSGPRRPVVGTNPGTGRLGIDPTTIPVGPDRRWCDEELGRLRLFEDARARRDLIMAARMANVAIYTLSPAGLGGENVGERGFDLMSAHTNSLLELANETDAVAVLSTNDLDAGLGRIVEDLSAHYTLGYYTNNTNWNGGLRRIEVRLSSTGAKIRSRRQYRAPTEAEMASAREAVEREPRPGPALAEVALTELARLNPRTSLFTRGVHVGSRVYVAVELPSASAGGDWSSGATVRLEATSGREQVGGAVEARIEPGMRSALLAAPAEGAGPWSFAIELTGRGGTIRDQLEIAPAAEGAVGRPLVFRATPSPRSALLPVAEPVFRRTERLRLEWRLTAPLDATDARLLSAQGEPLSVPVALSTREEPTGVVLAADLILAPLAPADYVVEIMTAASERAVQSHFAFRVTR